uniref:Uncharacterized protein n=1 Tax=Globodera pallida TaxID=36090 RepID=A0A183C2A5_GLOPA
MLRKRQIRPEHRPKNVQQRQQKNSLELLTNILLNDLCLANEARTEPLFDALIEYMDCNGPTHNRQNQLFTELVNGCLDHFMSSKMFFLNSASVPLVVPPSAKTQLNQSAEYTSANVVRFLSRVIDTVWNGLYKGNPIRILKCFLKLLAEAHASNKAAAQLQCTDAHISSLFRLILYLLSRPIDNVDTQMCVLDTLAEIVRNQQLFLTPKSNVDPLFYAALVHLVFMLSDRPQFDLQDRRNRELERGTAQVSICAQSVWGILWQHKKAVLEEWLKKGDLDLDLFTSRAKCGEAANRAWLQFVDSQTVGNNSQSQQQQDSYSTARLLNAQKMLPTQLQTKLSRVARNGLRKLRNSTAAGIANAAMGDSSESKQWLNALARFDDERLRVEPETFYMWIRVHISLVRELIRNQCQRYHEWHAHVRKWCVQEWHYAETELIRERGLWGPNCGSALNKFQLDITEGPCRIRRKLVPNPDFYRHYPYRPNLEGPKAKPMRAKVAISRDSKAYWERMSKKRAETMDERIVDFQAGLMPSPGGIIADQSPGAGIEKESDQTANDSVAELNISMIKQMVEKNLEHTEKAESIDEDVKRKREIEQNVVFDEDEVEEEEMDEEDEGMRDKSPKLAKEAEGTETAELELVEKTSAEGRKDICETEQKPLEMKKHHRRRDQSLGEPISQGPDNQTFITMFRCARVQGLDIMEGLLLFGKDHFYVVDGFTLLKTREIRDLDFLPEHTDQPLLKANTAHPKSIRRSHFRLIAASPNARFCQQGGSKPKLSKEDLEFLKKNTNFTEEQIKEWYKGFVQDCPKGHLTKEQFIKVYKDFFPSGSAEGFCEHVFRTFDTDNSGFIDFKEFLLAINVTSSGTPEQKLEWAFRMYDIDGNGTIDEKEMIKIIEAIYEMLGPEVTKSADDSPRKRAKMIFEKMDVNNDKELTLKEFVDGCLADKELFQILTNEDDKAIYVAFLRELKKALPSGTLLSIASAASAWYLDPGFDLAGIAATVDFINVMCYEYYGAWSQSTGPIAALYNGGSAEPSDQLNCNWTINYHLSKMHNPEKLNLGVPFYGKFWTNVSEPLNGDGLWRLGTYGNALAWQDLSKSFNLTQTIYQTTAKTPYIYDDLSKIFLTFDNPQSLIEKASYADLTGLGGIMICKLFFIVSVQLININANNVSTVNLRFIGITHKLVCYLKFRLVLPNSAILGNYWNMYPVNGTNNEFTLPEDLRIYRGQSFEAYEFPGMGTDTRICGYPRIYPDTDGYRICVHLFNRANGNKTNKLASAVPPTIYITLFGKCPNFTLGYKSALFGRNEKLSWKVAGRFRFDKMFSGQSKESGQNAKKIQILISNSKVMVGNESFSINQTKARGVEPAYFELNLNQISEKTLMVVGAEKEPLKFGQQFFEQLKFGPFLNDFAGLWLLGVDIFPRLGQMPINLTFWAPPECKLYAVQQRRHTKCVSFDTKNAHQLPGANSLIAGGHPIDIEIMPSTVHISIEIFFYKTKNVSILRICAGSLISPEFVLTAAHCFINITDGQKLTLTFNSNSSVIERNSKGFTRAFTQQNNSNVFVHHNFDSNKIIGRYDLALIKLNAPIPHQLIYPICIHCGPAENFRRGSAIIAGWGKTHPNGNISKELVGRFAQLTDCKKAHNQSITICTEGHTALKGDSGGPLFASNGSNFVLIGILSGNKGPKGQSVAAVFANIRQYSRLDGPWIQRITGTKCAN